MDELDWHHVEHNARVLRHEWAEAMDAGLAQLRPAIMAELGLSGFAGWLTNPFIEFAARSYLRTARRDAFRQLDIVLATAKDVIKSPPSDLDLVIDRHFIPFAKLDETYVYGKKAHASYPDIVRYLKEEFKCRVEDTAKLLLASPDNENAIFHTAAEIYLYAYPDGIESAWEVQEMQLALIQKRAELVRENESLLPIPFGLRDKVLKIFDKGYELTIHKQREMLENYWS